MSEARQGPFDHEKTWREDQRFAINIDIFKSTKIISSRITKLIKEVHNTCLTSQKLKLNFTT